VLVLLVLFKRIEEEDDEAEVVDLEGALNLSMVFPRLSFETRSIGDVWRTNTAGMKARNRRKSHRGFCFHPLLSSLFLPISFLAPMSTVTEKDVVQVESLNKELASLVNASKVDASKAAGVLSKLKVSQSHLVPLHLTLCICFPFRSENSISQPDF
jgi:hypothetical protein